MIEIEARILVLDLDDTLYLERQFAQSGFRFLAREFGARIGGARFAAECTELLAQGRRGNIFDLALSRCGIEATRELVDDLVARYRAHEPEVCFCADTDRLFNRLPKMPTGLSTDRPQETQWAKIRALRLDQIIDHIVATGEWGREFSKPHPRAFEKIESLSSSSGRSLVYVADNASKDFVTPRQRGWQTVQILRAERIHVGTAPAPGHEADHAISSFDDLQVSPLT